MLLLHKNIDLFLNEYMMDELMDKYKTCNMHDFCMWLAEQYSEVGSLSSYGNDSIPVGYSCNADGSRKEIDYVYILLDNYVKIRVFKDYKDYFVSQVPSKSLKEELEIRGKL